MYYKEDNISRPPTENSLKQFLAGLKDGEIRLSQGSLLYPMLRDTFSFHPFPLMIQQAITVISHHLPWMSEFNTRQCLHDLLLGYSDPHLAQKKVTIHYY